MAHRREGWEERCGILLGLIYQQLGGKCWVDTAQRLTVGQGLGPLATDRHQQGAEVAEKSTTHKHWNTHSHLLLFGLTLLSSPSLSRRGGCLSRIRHPRVPAAAPVNACISFFLFSFLFFWRLLPCLFVSMLHPPQWQGYPTVPDGPPTSPTYTSFIKIDLDTALKIKWQNVFVRGVNSSCECSWSWLFLCR